MHAICADYWDRLWPWLKIKGARDSDEPVLLNKFWQVFSEKYYIANKLPSLETMEYGSEEHVRYVSCRCRTVCESMAICKGNEVRSKGDEVCWKTRR